MKAKAIPLIFAILAMAVVLLPLTGCPPDSNEFVKMITKAGASSGCRGCEAVEGEPEGEGEDEQETLAVIAATLLEDFAATDANDDKKLTFAEARAAWPGLTRDQFDALDTDEDGFLTEGELQGAQIVLQLVKWQLETAAPNYVNVLFQVLDAEGIGVTDLETSHFVVEEDSAAISPTESFREIKKQDRLPYMFYTVLMLDNSASVGANLGSIRTAAKRLVNGIGAKQRIAVYSFSNVPVRVLDFTGIEDRQAILDAVDSIQLGFPTTNLYGAVVEGVAQWTNQSAMSGISQGALVLLTDGSDTQGSATLYQALNARGDKRCYTIGVGNEINTEALTELGNAGHYFLAAFSELEATFAQIQVDIAAYANSLYLLQYNSPKRGNKDHNLSLYATGPYRSNILTGSFNSRDLYDVMPGVYINDGYDNHDGINEVIFAEGTGQEIELQVHTYFGTPGVAPVYACLIEDETICGIVSITGNCVILQALKPGEVSITIQDTANGFSNVLDVTVHAVVPDVYNLVESEAVLALEAAGLVVGEIKEYYIPTIEAGHVRRASVTAGTAVAPGTVIDIVVSLGEPDLGEEETVLLPGDVPLTMVWIPGGTFQMGRYAGEQDSNSNEDPQHAVTVPGFWMGKYEVTQAQWLAVMGSWPGTAPSFSYGVGDTYPAYYVSWDDAQNFITALNAHIVSSGQGPLTVRLPSEAEWEYACRAGTQTRFYWGDDADYTQIGNYAWYEGNNSPSGSKPVGGKLPNAFGLYDMSGNVWEWCQDWYHSSYSGAPADGSAWESPTGSYRVGRGGGWYYGAGHCRSADRGVSSPGIRINILGFRLAAGLAVR